MYYARLIDFLHYLCGIKRNKRTIMETTTVNLNKGLVNQALQITRAKGMELSDVIERFLITFVSSDRKQKTEDEYPDIVLSLLGQGTPVEDGDINGRKAYREYLMDKHK